MRLDKTGLVLNAKIKTRRGTDGELTDAEKGRGAHAITTNPVFNPIHEAVKCPNDRHTSNPSSNRPLVDWHLNGGGSVVMGGYSEGVGGEDGLDGFRVVLIRVWFLHPRPCPVPAFPPHVPKQRQGKGESE
jgi:hypothetical protein